MSYYFTILSSTDAPLFSLSFGTSKSGGDGIAHFRFPESSRYMNQFILHASLDVVEELQWTNGALYVTLRCESPWTAFPSPHQQHAPPPQNTPKMFFALRLTRHKHKKRNKQVFEAR